MVTRPGLDPSLLQPFIDSVGDGVVVADLTARPVRWNAAAERVLGAAVLKGDEESLVFKADRATPAALYERPIDLALRGIPSDEREVFVVPKGKPAEDGVLLSVTARPLRDEDGNVWGGVAVFRDITKRRATEEKVRESEHLYRALARNLPEMSVVLFTRDLRILLSEGPAFALAGADARSFEQRSLREVIAKERAPALVPKYEEAFLGVESTYGSTVNGRSYRVKVVPVRDVSGEVFAGMLIIQDITEILRVEGARREADPSARAAASSLLVAETEAAAIVHLGSVGALAAGLAYEIGDPLEESVLHLDHALEIAARERPLEGAARVELEAALRDAREGALKIREILRNMRLLSRGEAPPRTPVNVERTIDAAIQLGANRLRASATIERSYAGVPPVFADEAKLGQLLASLLRNAAQAMPPRPPRESVILVSTAYDAPDHVVVIVQDNGVGMPPGVLARAFEPFFTTRPTDEGVGLGLAVARAIAESLGGTLRAESEEGVGSTFFLRLPVARIPLDGEGEGTKRPSGTWRLVAAK